MYARLARLAPITALSSLLGLATLAGCAEDSASTAEAEEALSSVPQHSQTASGGTAASPTASNAPRVTPACAAKLANLRFDFESGAQGWTHGISDGVTWPPYPHDPWAVGQPTNGAPCSVGSCFATELRQNYAQCQRGYVLSPPLDLSACQGQDVALLFEHTYAFWKGWANGEEWYDGGIVEVSGDDGATWSVPASTSYSGYVSINPAFASTYCINDQFGASGKLGFVGKQAIVATAELRLCGGVVGPRTRVRFSFASGASSSTISPDESRALTSFGWRFDNVHFEPR